MFEVILGADLNTPVEAASGDPPVADMKFIWRTC